MEQQIRFCTSADGTRIAYATYGAQRGRPLVFVYSFAYTLDLMWDDPSWNEFGEILGEGRLVVNFDRRGTGASQREVDDVSLEAELSDVSAVADHLGVQTFDLLGWSDGSAIAVAYASRFPERVSRLVLSGPYVRGQDWAAPDAARSVIELIGTDWELGCQLLASLLTAGSIEQQPERARWLRGAMLPEVAAKMVKFQTALDISSLLPDVHVPALVIHVGGAARAFNKASALKVASLIPGARFADLSAQSPGPELNALLREHVVGFLDEGRPTAGALPVAEDVATILFTDIESSTALTQRLGDAKAQELVRAHNSMVREALQMHDGAEIKHTGDGIMASFTSPAKALGCAIAIQRAVAAFVDQREERPLAVRIGLNAGEPVVEEADLFGTAVQLARRICDYADAGQVLASNVVRELAAGKGFLFADIGEVVPKGFEEPVRLYEVRWREET